jgi:hypothetical protein
MNNTQIIRQLENLTAERKTIDSTWETIEEFIAPYRGQFFRNRSSEHEQNWRQRQIFDGTAIMDNIILSNTLHSWLFPMGRDFFNIKFRDDDINDNQEAREWTVEVVKRMHKALHQSNLNTESGEVILDKTTFGTGYLLQEFQGDELTGEGFEISFSAIPVKEAYFDEDFKGGVYAFYRRLMWTPTQIVSKFGEDNVPEKINTLVAGGKTDRMEVVFCIWKRKDIKADEVDGIVSAELRPYAFKYVLKEGGETLGEEGGYYEMPLYLSRWSKTSESKFGHSPSMIALSDVLTLNQFKELIIRRSEKEVDGSYMATQRGLLSDLDLQPGGLNIVKDMNSLQALDIPGNFSIANLTEESLKESIHRAYYLDSIALKESPQMTATETLERTAIMQRSLGPVISRNKPSLLAPLVENTFNAMMRSNKLPDVPDSIKGADIDIVYTGPLAASSNMEDAQLLQTYLNIVNMVAEVKPQIMDNINEDHIARSLADDLNIDPGVNNSKEEVEALRAARQQQEQAAFEAQNLQEGGKAMQEMAKGEQAMRGEPNA